MTEQTTEAAVLDVLSEDFADFALDEMEATKRMGRSFTADGQTFIGRVLGFGSSYKDSEDHRGHIPGTPPKPGTRCSVCRWADVAIFETDVNVKDGHGMYAVATMGKSAVEGESQRLTMHWMRDAMGVLRSIAVPDRSAGDASWTRKKIPMPNAIAFRYAAFADDAIAAVLEEYDDAVPDYRDRESDLGF
jgi:hypothetical protein